MDVDRLVSDANVEVAVPSHDVGVVLATAEHIEAAERTGSLKDTRGGVHTAALRAANAPGQIVYRVIHRFALRQERRTAVKGADVAMETCTPFRYLYPRGGEDRKGGENVSWRPFTAARELKGYGFG
jgi:hypothetical protein